MSARQHPRTRRRWHLLLAFCAIVAVAPLIYDVSPLAALIVDDEPANTTEVQANSALEDLLEQSAAVLQGLNESPEDAIDGVSEPEPSGDLVAPRVGPISGPAALDGPTSSNASAEEEPAITIVVLLTAMALIPTVLVLATSFTRMVIVFGLTRNALGLQGIPNNQVLIGLSLFLTIFVMSPVLSDANDNALQPFLDGEIEQGDAIEAGIEPFRDFMMNQVRDEDLQMFIDLSGEPLVSPADDVPLTTLVPAFIVGELRAAFLIGFIIFVPFLIVDLVTAAALMSMGMMMLPPVVISLPFKLLLFVMVDGWFLLVPTLVESYNV